MDLYAELSKIIDEERITTNETIREQHGRDESFHTPQLPDIVVFPLDAKEVSEILAFANNNNIAVTPFGVGSSLEGHIIPYQGGITIDFSQMNKILEVRPEDFLVRVQPGVTRMQLNKELKKHGLFFPVDPGADATLGGMAATNASGTTAVRYGVMRDQVRDLEVVLADGRIIHTGRLAPKSSSGYHLTGLFVGSEGTLGCITELTLKVHGIPEYNMTARAVFPSAQQAVESVVMIQSAGIPIARCEFVDAQSIKQVNEYNKLSYPEKPTLFLEFQGNEATLKHDIDFTTEIVNDCGCEEIVFETDSKKAHELWEVRHQLAYSFIHSYPKKEQMATDVCLPISELAGALEFSRKKLEELGLIGGLFGHVGDGNYHTIVMLDPNDEEELSRAYTYNESIVEYALVRGGTCTGEHGVGYGKKKYQRQEHGEAYDIMKAIKQMLDPNGILNPHKIFPDDE